MKKTLLALTVAAFATSAQAQVELYKDDASSVKVKGQIATFAYQSDIDYKSSAVADKKTDLDINAWAKAQFDFHHKVTDSLTVGGTFEIQSGADTYNKTSNDAEFDDVAVFFKGDFGLVGIGEIGDISDADDAVSKTDILNELANEYLPKGVASDSQGSGISYTKEFGAFTAVVDAYTEENEHVDNIYGVSLNYQAEIFSVGANYRTQGDQTPAAGADLGRDSWSISADVTPIDALTLAATYNVYTEEVGASVADTELTNVTFSASYAATDAVTLYGVYGTQDKEETGVKYSNASDIVLGASYAATDLLTVFTEVASRENQAQDETTEILFGAYLDF